MVRSLLGKGVECPRLCANLNNKDLGGTSGVSWTAPPHRSLYLFNASFNLRCDADEIAGLRVPLQAPRRGADFDNRAHAAAQPKVVHIAI